MAKKKYILTISNRTALARNKRLREAGASVYINGSSITQAGTSGVDEKGVVDVDVQGSGNAVTDAKLSSDGSTIVLNKGKTFLDNATAEGKFIRKDQDDGTPYSLYVNTDFDVKGTTTVQTLQVNGNATMAQLLDVYGKLTARGGVQFGSSFMSGLLGEGGYFDNKGYGEMRGLTLWEWLEVPELRYNRVTVNTGITWQTFGGGIIESVEVTGENTGIITLKLEDGEIGTIAQDDLCMGIYHNFGGGNDTEDVDEHNGNFHFSGFKTIYFRVEEILDTDTNGKFSYVLRESQQGHWTEQNHPCEYMHFAAYANPNNTDRQNCHYSTTKYLISLQNMTDWEYGNNNIYYIRGILEGFTVGDTELHGDGIYIGNGYFSGIIQQIENAPYALNIEYKQGDTLMEEDEVVDISCTVSKGWQDMTGKVKTWVVKRETGDTEADEEWNNAHTDFDGTIEVTYDEMFGGGNISALLRFTATMEDGTEVSNSTILHAYNVDDSDYRLEIDTKGDTFIGYGDIEPLKVTCEVYKGWTNKTDEVTSWSVSRDSGQTAEDNAWNADHTDFAGYIELVWADLGTDYTRQSVVFTFTAANGVNKTSATVIIG